MEQSKSETNSNSVIFLKPEIDRAKLYSDETKSVFHSINSGETGSTVEDSKSSSKTKSSKRHERQSDFDMEDSKESMVTD